MRTRNLKRLLSLVLCLCMVTGLLPTAALAADVPAITTETLEAAMVGEEYTAVLEAEASDPSGTLTWEAEGLPAWLELWDNADGTASLTGKPGDVGEFTFTVTVTETIPAAEPEEPAAQEAGPDGVTEPAGESQPTGLTASRTYTLTVAEAVQAEPEPEPEPEPASEPAQEPAQEPADEPAANAPLTDGAGATRTTHQSVSATIYLDNGDGQWTDEEEKTTFPVDQAGLILDLRNFDAAIPQGEEIASMAFSPAGSTSSEGSSVFWYEGCTNGTPHDKLYNNNGTYNGVFQLEGFAPNGNGEHNTPTPGQYQVMLWVYDPNTESETTYLSTETFTITAAAGPGGPVITTATLPDATVGVNYETPLAAAPATSGTLSWSITSGNLPDGLQLDANTGKISGTPTAAGSYSFTVQVSEENAGGEPLTATKELTLTVTAPLVLSTGTGGTTFDLTRGEPFTLQLTANQPVTWSFQDGYMPGLRLSGDTISGTVSSYTSSGTYTATMRATAADGQTADITLTFTVGDLYAFTLPESLSNDMIGHYAYLRATLDGKEVTLWSGALSSLYQQLTVYSSYSGKTVNNVELYVRLNKGGNVEAVLANAAGSVTLTDGDTSPLTAANTDTIIALPEFDYGGLDNYVSAWFEDSDGYRYYSGDLATADMTFTLEASANPKLYRQNGNSTYDLNGTPSFSGTGVNSTTYTASGGSGGPITVTYPQLTKQTVTFTLEPVSEAEPEDLTGAQLSIQQYVNGAAVRTSATITSGSTATAELYLGAETTVTLLRASNCGLKDTKIDQVEEENTLEYWTSAQTGISLILTPTLSNMEDKDLLTYAESLPTNSIYPTITVGGESWNGRGGFSSSLSVTKNIGKPLSFGIWNYDYADEIQSMVDSGGTYSLSWSATQSLLDGNLENQKWPSDQLSASVELPINLKGGVLLSLTYSGRSAAHLQDWWYDSSSNTWITSGNRTSVYSTKGEARNYAFCCPGEEDGTYGFILLPREAQPTGMTWADAAEYYAGMPALADVPVEDNTVASASFVLNEVQAAAARYLTLPNSTLSGPAQFTSTEELLSFTGGIQLDEGVDGKLKTLRIEASGTDRGGRVAFQISSLQIGGKTYP